MTHEFWFKPKSFGYGATPTTWEGWAVVAAYALLVLACAVATTTHKGSLPTFVVSMGIIAIATIALIVVSVKKTDGAWGWNAGAKQDSGKRD